jgi:hypothetical protein
MAPARSTLLDIDVRAVVWAARVWPSVRSASREPRFAYVGLGNAPVKRWLAITSMRAVFDLYIITSTCQFVDHSTQ